MKPDTQQHLFTRLRNLLFCLPIKYSLLVYLLVSSCTAIAQKKPRNWDDLSKEEKYYYSIYLEERWGGLKPFLTDGYWGFKDQEGEEVIHAQFDALKKNKYHTGPMAKNIIAQRGKKWGIIDIEGNELVPFIYEEIEYFFYSAPDGFPEKITFREKGKWGLRFIKGKTIVPPKYDSIGVWPAYNAWTVFKSGNKYGLFDCLTGEDVYPAEFDQLQDVTGRYLRGRISGKAGIVSPDKKIRIPFIYEEVFYDEHHPQTAKVKLKGKWGVVDTNGNIIFPIQYDEIMQYQPHDLRYAKVKRNGKIGFVDRNGKEKIAIIYDWFYNQSGGNFVVSKDNNLGVIDTSGKIIIPVLYDDLAHGTTWPSPPPTKVKLNGFWAFMDSTGKVATSFKYQDIQHWYAPIISVKFNNKWGFINKAGTEIIDFKYDSVEYHYGYFICSLNGKWGMLNEQGTALTRFIYDAIKPHNLYTDKETIGVLLNEQWGFLDPKGKVLISPRYKFEEVLPFTEGLAAVSKDGSWGYINKAGKVVIPIIYQSTRGYFLNGKTSVKKDDKYYIMDNKGRLLKEMFDEYELEMEEEGDF